MTAPERATAERATVQRLPTDVGRHDDHRGSSTPTTVIGINLTWLIPGVVGGSEEYTMRLLEAVPDFLDSRLELRIYGRRQLFRSYPRLADLHRIAVMPEPALPGALSKVARVGLEQTWLAAASGGDHVVHHAGGTMPFLRRQPGIVTVHDLQPLEMPEHFHPVKRRWLARAIPASVRSARLVLCPSRHTAARIHELLGVPEHRLRVVHHGHRHRPAEGEIGLDPTRFGRYLLYPAIAYPHKRHVDVVRTVAGLGSDLGDVSAVFTGRAGPELEVVRSEAKRLGVSDRVHILGRVPTEDLQELYRRAVALVFPSAYEGFGNPALEAMSIGCPAIVSDGGALPEVVADAGLVVPVGDVDGLVRAVTDVVEDPALADDLRHRGRSRAAEFDIGIAARTLAEVYGEVIDSRPG